MPGPARAAAVAAFSAPGAPRRALLTTDVAARGLDLPSVHCVVQVDAPSDWKQYAHRAGRAGRMGARGEVLSLSAGAREAAALAAAAARLGVRGAAWARAEVRARRLVRLENPAPAPAPAGAGRGVAETRAKPGAAAAGGKPGAAAADGARGAAPRARPAPSTSRRAPLGGPGPRRR
jgi:superfamily II DNA/RNA helicase